MVKSWHRLPWDDLSNQSENYDNYQRRQRVKHGKWNENNQLLQLNEEFSAWSLERLQLQRKPEKDGRVQWPKHRENKMNQDKDTSSNVSENNNNNDNVESKYDTTRGAGNRLGCHDQRVLSW